MVSPIPKRVQELWENWNLRVCITLSLSLQVILIVCAPLRKRCGNICLVSLIWCAYLLADCVALFSFGLISKKQDDINYNNNKKDMITNNGDLLAIWAPFCLLHLGGPDTITAFSIEDNALWLRHLMGLIVQVTAAVYVFIESLPTNKLWLPTCLLFVAGIIKYSERTRALYLANLNNFRAYPGLDYAKLMQEFAAKKTARVPAIIRFIAERIKKSVISKAETTNNKENLGMVRQAHHLYTIFKGLIVDQLVLFLNRRNESRHYFHQISSDSEHAFGVLAIELNFFYQVLYTKARVVNSKPGYVFRFLSSVSILASLSLFISSEKSSFHNVDIWITYVLFGGAIALDVIAFLVFLFSDWTVVERLEMDDNKDTLFRRLLNKYLELKRLNWQSKPESSYYFAGARRIMFRRWSESVSGCNLIKYCLQELRTTGPKTPKIIQYWHTLFSKTTRILGLEEFREKWKYLTAKSLKIDLWEFIFQQLRTKSEEAEDPAIAKIISSRRVNWFLKESDPHIIDLIRSYVIEIDYGESLLLWHLATEICYNCSDTNESEIQNREFSKVLSRYMLYLMWMQPTLMSSVAGIGKIRFRDTCADAKRFFGHQTRGETSLDLKEACQRILKVSKDFKRTYTEGSRSKSVLLDACSLAKELNEMENSSNKWMLVSQVWVELLSYAACRCRPYSHLQLLGRGGEFITYVWLLMAHFGIGAQLYITEDNAVAKLIVGK